VNPTADENTNTAEHSLEIAGIRLRLSTPGPLRLPELEAPHHAFASAVGETSVSGVQIELRTEDLTRFNEARTLFQLNPRCRVRDDGDGRLLLRMPDSDTLPALWVFRFDRHATRATLFIDRGRVTPGNPKSLELNPLGSMWVEILAMVHLAARDGLLLHGTGVEHNGSGWIFAGPSGSGKSTLASLVCKRDGMQILSDERLAVRKVDGEWFLFGTPWCSSAGAALPRRAPLRGIFFLRHGRSVAATPLSPSTAVDRFLPVAAVPWRDTTLLPDVIDVCDRFVKDIPGFDLCFPPDDRVVDYIASLGTAPRAT